MGVFMKSSENTEIKQGTIVKPLHTLVLCHNICHEAQVDSANKNHWADLTNNK